MFIENMPLPEQAAIALEFGKKSASILFYSPQMDFFACPRLQVPSELAVSSSFLEQATKLFDFPVNTPLVVAKSAKQHKELLPYFLNSAPVNLTDKAFFTSGSLVMDSFCARLHGLMFLPPLYKRNFREGLCILHVGKSQIHAALVFQQRLYGYFTAPIMPAKALQELLESFRLAWLPEEKAQAVSGLSFLSASLPAQAEGFKPLYIFGSNADAFKNLGQIIQMPFDQQFLGCWGVLATAANL